MIAGVAVLLALLLPVGAGGSAVASEPPIAKARLKLGAAPDCMTGEDLIARVAARSPRIQFVNDASAVGVEATFTAARSGGVDAELLLVEPGVKTAPRRMHAGSCAEAADAVALIIAVALDPVWVNAHRPPVTGEPSVATSAGQASAASTASPSAVPPFAKPAARPTEPSRELVTEPARVEPSPVEVASPAHSAAARRRGGAHLAGQMIWGPAPAVMPGVAIHAIAALDRDALWSPAIMIGATHAWRNGLAEAGGTAAFALDAGTLDACALRVRLSIVDARACGALLVGRFAASGSDTKAPATVARLFATAGAAAVLTASLGSMVELFARIGTGLTLRRDTYEFIPTEFHQVSRFTTDASLGLGLRLP
jgi:hypothetical protein